MLLVSGRTASPGPRTATALILPTICPPASYTRALKKQQLVGWNYIDRTQVLRGPSDATFFDVVEKRSKLDDLLQTNLSATTTFKAGVAIFTPLAASLTSTLLSG
jgi:hypothetical protein